MDAVCRRVREGQGSEEVQRMSSTGDSAEEKSLEDMSYEEICELSPNELVRVSPVRHHPSKTPPEEE
jgi:hypothetical protein